MDLRAQAPDLYTGKMDRYWLLMVMPTIITKGIIYIVAGIALSIVSITVALINKRYKQDHVKYFFGSWERAYEPSAICYVSFSNTYIEKAL